MSFFNFKIQPKCKHRHTVKTHPHCFLNGIPISNLEKTGLPNVLIVDVETSPLEAYIWQHDVWGGNVSENQVISEWFMLTWSAKWLFDDKIISERLTGKEAVREEDNRIVKSLWSLLDKAHIVIAHNGDRFDVPNMNTRFIVNNLPPPSFYESIDTLKIAKKQFGFSHNNLNALARVFGLRSKMETNFELWRSAKNGDETALKYMEQYNRGDVELLEEIYMKLRPWIKSHPNLGLYIESDSPVCSNCGSLKLIPTKKFYYTQTGKYFTFRCGSCGAYVRSRRSSVSKDVSKNLVVGLAK